MFWFYEAVWGVPGRILGVETHIAEPMPLSDPVMLQDQLDIAFICGLPFVRHYRVISGQLKAIVAPVMQSSRYQDRPVYFSISSSTLSGLKTFDELVGKTLCYNDQGLWLQPGTPTAHAV